MKGKVGRPFVTRVELSLIESVVDVSTNDMQCVALSYRHRASVALTAMGGRGNVRLVKFSFVWIRVSCWCWEFSHSRYSRIHLQTADI